MSEENTFGWDSVEKFLSASESLVSLERDVRILIDRRIVLIKRFKDSLDRRDGKLAAETIQNWAKSEESLSRTLAQRMVIVANFYGVQDEPTPDSPEQVEQPS